MIATWKKGVPKKQRRRPSRYFSVKAQHIENLSAHAAFSDAHLFFEESDTFKVGDSILIGDDTLQVIKVNNLVLNKLEQQSISVWGKFAFMQIEIR